MEDEITFEDLDRIREEKLDSWKELFIGNKVS